MILASLSTRGRLRAIRWLAGLALQIAVCAGASDALAHASERGHVLLLPTRLYIAGGALAVAASFVVLWLGGVLVRRSPPKLELAALALPRWLPVLTSLVCAALLGVLLVAAYTGAPDPIRNPLPGFIWGLWWIGLTFLTGLIGNPWPVINPWSGPASILRRAIGTADDRPLFVLPERLGQWPAVALFLAFAWLELVDPKAEDPRHLANAVIAYSALTIGGMVLFGAEIWTRRVECFSIFFRMIGALAPLQWRDIDGRLTLRLGMPGHALGQLDLSPPGAVAFVLVALSTVSFDGVMRTFTWLGLVGVNPLEFPGRSAMVGINTIGLAGFAVLFLAVYSVVTTVGSLGNGKLVGWAEPAKPSAPTAVAGLRAAMRPSAPAFAASIVPIAFGYHLAHYLPALPLEALNALKAMSDPFATGMDLLGLAGFEPPQSLTAGHVAATFVYRLQTAIIVTAHVMAVFIAHGIATRLAGDKASALRLELPLTLLMIGYTVLGLWLLSTPVIG